MYRKDSPHSIRSMFDSIAANYDFANSVLSFSLHRRWKQTLARHLLPSPAFPTVFLDLCAGTGDITFEYLRLSSAVCHAHLIDFSPQMLYQAKQKASHLDFPHAHRLSYFEADVHQLPLSENMADSAAMAYGIRNVHSPDRCMQEVFRVLKPNGHIGILELTRPSNRFLRLGHRLYLRTFLPCLGKWLTRNAQAYEYLCQSIQTFIEPEAVEALLQGVGFASIQRRPLAGGIATLFIGHKPSHS